MEEEEALRNYCRRMIRRVRSEQPRLDSSGEEERRRRRGLQGARGRQGAGSDRQVEAGAGFGDQAERRAKRDGARPSPGLGGQGPGVRPVPAQLISVLRLKTFEEETRRAAEAEPHDPAACGVCERQRASLAFTGFIRRKKTQLQFQTLKARLNTHLGRGVSDFELHAAGVPPPADVWCD